MGIEPLLEAYGRNFDETLIRENLKKTVDERFLELMERQRFVEELRQAGRKLRKNDGLQENSATPE